MKETKMKFKPMTLLFFTCVLIFSSCTEGTIELFVSKSGQPGDHGSKEAPLNDIHEAITMAEQLRDEDSEVIININILPGEYRLTSPLHFTPELKGVNLIGSGATEVSIKGSIPLELKWEKYDNAIFMADVSEDLQFDQLIINDQLQTLARYPDYDENGGYWQGFAANALSAERIASWQKPDGAFFHVMHSGKWGGFHYLVTGVDDDGDAILEGGHQNNRPSRPHPLFRMVENVFEELDGPGEWYFDASIRQLYYWPPEDIDIETAKFEGVILKNLIEIKGNLENPVKDITIKGIKFEYAQRTIMEPYEPLLRSDWTIYRGGALYLEGTENCLFIPAATTSS